VTSFSVPPAPKSAAPPVAEKVVAIGLATVPLPRKPPFSRYHEPVVASRARPPVSLPYSSMLLAASRLKPLSPMLACVIVPLSSTTVEALPGLVMVTVPELVQESAGLKPRLSVLAVEPLAAVIDPSLVQLP